MSEVCPKCSSNDQIGKISSIYSNGTTSGYFSGPTGSVNYSQGKTTFSPGFTIMRGSQQTTLAAALEPPRKPIKGNALGCIGWSVVSVVVVGLIIAIINVAGLADTQAQFGHGQEYTNIAIGLFVLLFGVIIFVAAYYPKKSRELEKKYHLESKSWDEAMKRWSRLYYCFRDDLVFDPLTQYSFSPGYMTDYLYGDYEDIS